MRNLFMATLLLLAGCRSTPEIIDGANSRAIDAASIQWTDEERAADVAVIELRRGSWSSEHLIRLAGSEKPHVHQRHDFTATLLSGRVVMHVGEDAFEMRPGDVASIPHGLTHWAENVANGPSVAHVVFTPPFDSADTLEVQP